MFELKIKTMGTFEYFLLLKKHMKGKGLDLGDVTVFTNLTIEQLCNWRDIYDNESDEIWDYPLCEYDDIKKDEEHNIEDFVLVYDSFGNVRLFELPIGERNIRSIYE